MILILIAILGTLGIILYKGIHKYSIYLFIVATAISIFSVLNPDIAQLEPITEGFLGLAFLYLVMIAGAFKKGTYLNKRLRSIRKEYSVLGFILLSPHAIYYLLLSLNGDTSFEWLGIIAFVVMIPLFVISFTTIKKRMEIKNWYIVHKASYFVYLLIYLHLILIGLSSNIPIYTVLFAIYTFLKLKNYVFSTYDIAKALVVTPIVIFALLISTGTEIQVFGSTSEDGLSSDVILVDGTYTGSATGYKTDRVNLQVVIENGEITEINMFDCGCTEIDKDGKYLIAANAYVAQLLSSGGTDVDFIAGATESSEGIYEAFMFAIESAIEE